MTDLRRSNGGRKVLSAAILAALVAYFLAVDALPNQRLWADVVLTAAVLIPAVFALPLLALPVRHARGLAGFALALAALVLACELAHLDVIANFAKLAAASAIGFWFLALFERLSWVALVAVVIPVVDSLSVWRGPTHEIVSDRPEVFGVLSFAFPVPDEGSFQLGLPDLLFFAVFLGAAARWELRVGWTWLALTASFGVTMALAVWVDPLGLGGLPALPLLSVAFLAANADLLWRELRPRPATANSP